MTNYNDFLAVDTPENIAFGYEVAGIGSRFLAALVDTLIIIALQAIVSLALFFIVGQVLNEIFGDDIIIWGSAIFGLISFGLLWGYYIVFELLWQGQSPGKRWVGLRVLRQDGTPLTLLESIVRNLVRLVDFMPFYYGVGVVCMFIDKQARRLGDLAAGTLVVFDQSDVSLESLAHTPSSENISAEVSAFIQHLPLERLTNTDLQMIEALLARQYQIPTSPELAQDLLAKLLNHLGLDNTIDLPGTSLNILKAIVVQRRQGEIT